MKKARPIIGLVVLSRMVLSGIALSGMALSWAQKSIPSTGYDQPYRPQVHYSPRRHWMNDPNGPIFFEGEYHLFYQYNPFGDLPGHISWGHAVSRDLLHWQELGVAIPEANGAEVFTGSVVIDAKNTSGLCDGGKPCMIAVYTANRGTGATQQETQEIAASQDRGRTFQRYSGNPVLDLHMPDFRDPSVSWNDETKSWLMAVSLPNQHQVAFYTSANLKQWTRLTTFGPAGATAGQWECPDLLRVPSADGRESTWALKVGVNPGSLQGGSGEQYFLGEFDVHGFVQSGQPGSHGWTDYGKDSYCAISFNNLPAGAQPTLIGWMDNWQYAAQGPTSPWRGQMTLPRRVTLRHDSAGLALAEDPLVAPLRIRAGLPIHDEVSNGEMDVIPIATPPAEVDLRFSPGDATRFGLRLFSDAQHWTEVGFDRSTLHLYVDRTHAGTNIAPGFSARIEAPIQASRPFNLHLIVDRSSVEAFAQDGTVAMTDLIFPVTTSLRFQAFRKGGRQAVEITGRAWELGSIWKPVQGAPP